MFFLFFSLFCLPFFAFSLEELQCSSDEFLVQTSSKQILSNGCSKPSFIKIEGEEDFTYCCDRHDACYAICGINKQYCDDDFEKCMKLLCKTNFNNSPQCSSAASTYALGTKVFGQVGFLESQNDYCTCSKINEIDEYYKAVIHGFYHKYVPEKVFNYDNILSKYDTSSSSSSSSSSPSSSSLSKKYHQIYYDLHKKYDHAIGHVDGRKDKLDIPRPPKKVKEEL